MNDDRAGDGFAARLRESLASVDAWTGPGDAPDLRWFERLVAERKRELRRAFRRELAAFLPAAVWIVGGALILLSRHPALYFGLQAAIALAVAAAYPAFRRMPRGRREGRQ